MRLAQVRVGIINDVFAHEGKKIEDLEILKQLNDAVSALERSDAIQGIAARADYYSYRDQPEYAFQLINKAIKKHGYNLLFARSKMKAADCMADWNLIKESYEQALMCENLGLDEDTLHRYIEKSQLYVDNSGNFSKILKIHKFVDHEELYSSIDSMNEQILMKDCELPTYRKTIEIALRTILDKYVIQINLAFRINSLQFILSSDIWSDQDAVDMTKAINVAIMKEDDIDFQIAADEIEVFCINFPIKKLPDNFVYYEESDDDLIELVEMRMANNSSPELEGEELHV